MTLYYSIVFALLVLEMAMFMVLIVPLPFSARRKLFRFLATSEIVSRINYCIRITFIFVAVLFIDAFQRMIKVSKETNLGDTRATTTCATRPTTTRKSSMRSATSTSRALRCSSASSSHARTRSCST